MGHCYRTHCKSDLTRCNGKIESSGDLKSHEDTATTLKSSVIRSKLFPRALLEGGLNFSYGYLRYSRDRKINISRSTFFSLISGHGANTKFRNVVKIKMKINAEMKKRLRTLIKKGPWQTLMRYRINLWDDTENFVWCAKCCLGHKVSQRRR